MNDNNILKRVNPNVFHNLTNAENEYLSFNAYAMKDLIIRKLSQNPVFKNQIYAGSNLSVLIDILSYIFQTLMYNLNTSASESMFSDTVLYENVARLVKLLGYSPRGIVPSKATFQITNTNEDKFSSVGLTPFYSISTNLVDSTGKTVWFSPIEVIGTGGSVVNSGYRISGGSSKVITCFNGKLERYKSKSEDGKVIAVGYDNETIILDLMSNPPTYNIPELFYVFSKDANTGAIQYYKYIENSLFLDNSSNNNIYGAYSTKLIKSNEPVYTTRLRGDKRYEIQFGDNIIGRRPNAGDEIIIYYFDGNGENIDFSKLNSNHISRCVIEPVDCEYVGGHDIDDVKEEFKNLEVKILNTESDTTYGYKGLESTKELKENAVSWFRRGGRLVTKHDYEDYLIQQSQINASITYSDIKCLNNWDYTSSFYYWLYNVGLDEYGSGDKFLNQYNIRRNYYQFVDASDSNNIYIFFKPYQSDSTNLKDVQSKINNAISDIKDITHEIQIMEGIPIDFAITAIDPFMKDEYKLIIDPSKTDNKDQSEIVVTLAQGSSMSKEYVVSIIKDILSDYFSVKKTKLGQIVDLAEIYNKIINDCPDIVSIQTIYPQTVDNKNNVIPKRIVAGLNFAYYPRTNLLNLGDNLNFTNTNIKLEPFMYPRIDHAFLEQELERMIVVKTPYNRG